MEVNGRDYTVIRLLGKGKGGYSYLVTDGQRDYVLKQIHHEPCDYYSFGDKLQSELRDYARLRALGVRMPELLDVDEENERLLKAFVPGETVYDWVMNERMEPQYVEQMREMCRALYPAGINIDYFPTNFVIWEGLLWYIDYECNAYMEQWDFEHWGIAYWSKTDTFMDYVRAHAESGK